MSTGIESVFRRLFTVKDRRPIVEWAHDNIRFQAGLHSFPGPFDVSNLPWTRRIYEAWKDPKVRRIVVSGAPQSSGKTVAAQVCMAWQATNDPAPIGFYSNTDSNAKFFSDTRWKQMKDSCAPLNAKIAKDLKQQVMFKDGSFLLMLGAESKANRQSHTFRVIVKDEAWMYDAGAGGEIDKRKDSFNRTGDWKIIELGTGGVAKSEFAENHGKGTREVWEVPCPHCGGYHDYKWRKDDGGVFRWDLKLADDGKTVDIEKTLDTLHVECPHCHEKITWSQSGRVAANARGRWRATNEQADPSIVSITIPAFASGEEWRPHVRKWIELGHGRSVGKKKALQDFIMLVLAEFWEDVQTVEKQDLPHGDYCRDDMLNGKWLWPDGTEREVLRLATADYQHGAQGDSEHLWFVVRAYAENGDSRLVDCGRVNGFSDLAVRWEAAGVKPAPDGNHINSRGFVDIAFNENVILDDLMLHQWMGIRGEDRDTRNRGGSFPHTFKKGDTGETFTVWKNFSEVKWRAVGVGRSGGSGQYVPAYHINNQGIQDILFELRGGRSVTWEVPSDIEEFCPEYAKHLGSHVRRNVARDGDKPDFRWQAVSPQDHLYDCEKYQIGAALIYDLYHDASTAETAPQGD